MLSIVEVWDWLIHVPFLGIVVLAGVALWLVLLVVGFWMQINE